MIRYAYSFCFPVTFSLLKFMTLAFFLFTFVDESPSLVDPDHVHMDPDAYDFIDVFC